MSHFGLHLLLNKWIYQLYSIKDLSLHYNKIPRYNICNRFLWYLISWWTSLNYLILSLIYFRVKFSIIIIREIYGQVMSARHPPNIMYTFRHLLILYVCNTILTWSRCSVPHWIRILFPVFFSITRKMVRPLWHFHFAIRGSRNGVVRQFFKDVTTPSYSRLWYLIISDS